MLADYLGRTYLPLLPGTGKKPDTIVTEMVTTVAGKVSSVIYG